MIGKILAVTAIVAVLGGIVIVTFSSQLVKTPIPKLQREYWGEGAARPDDPAINQFKINISQEVIKDLHNRLRRVPTLTPPLEGANFRYGFNSDYLQRVVRFWRDEYDWRAREAFLNALPQFTTQLGGLRVHFVRAAPAQVPAGTRVLPLLLLHGWPGSVREFYELVPLLTAPRAGADFVFEVVAPSLPGYGFSEGARKQGLGPAQMGVLMHALMQRLGHKQYYVQGGDWGHAIGSAMATLFPESVLGFHTNMLTYAAPYSMFKIFLGSLFPSLVVDPEHQHRLYPLWNVFSFILEESGYLHIQSTKPDTIGTALSDSPVGLAAYMLERFYVSTNRDWLSLPHGGLEKQFALTNLLDYIMIYWVTGSITTSVRLYSEGFSIKNIGLQLDSIPCHVPTAIAVYPHEYLYAPESVAHDKYKNIVQFKHMPKGGHFAAFEEPHVFADDLWSAVSLMEKQKYSQNTIP